MSNGQALVPHSLAGASTVPHCIKIPLELAQFSIQSFRYGSHVFLVPNDPIYILHRGP